MALVKIGVHWINPMHVTNVSPEEQTDGSVLVQIDLVTGTGITLDDIPGASVDQIANRLNSEGSLK